eukprot:TRINITY_DN1684_c0_g1_i6.p2 TRINITY_DN1684_c0_g1~~TRINITY_DN1684_c0_g1_i6.p2  ORF type:complete len:185 (-),score=41.24 TRINITY_DN1684_c0_g1_i6:1015-1569(-)
MQLVSGMHIWSVRGGDLLKTLDFNNCCDVHLCANRLYSSSDAGTVSMTDVCTLQTVAQLNVENNVLYATEKYLGVAETSALKLYDPLMRSMAMDISTHSRRATGLHFDCGGLHIAATVNASGWLTVFDLRKQKALYAVQVTSRAINSVQFDAQKLILGEDTPDVMVLDYWTQNGLAVQTFNFAG